MVQCSTTENKRNPKAPDYRCKDAECAKTGGVIWPPRAKKPFQGFQGSKTPPKAPQDTNLEVLKLAVEVAKVDTSKAKINDKVLTAFRALKFILADKPEPKKAEEFMSDQEELQAQQAFDESAPEEEVL